MKKNIKLTKEESGILKLAGRGGFVSAISKKIDIARYSKIAKATLAKNKTISIRISEIDLIKLKAKAAQEGMPYQTLISSSLHRLTTKGGCSRKNLPMRKTREDNFLDIGCPKL